MVNRLFNVQGTIRANLYLLSVLVILYPLFQDVHFEVVPKDDIMVGSPFDIQVNVQNKSRNIRNYALTLTLTSVFYTGVPTSVIKTAKFNRELGAIKSE